MIWSWLKDHGTVSFCSCFWGVPLCPQRIRGHRVSIGSLRTVPSRSWRSSRTAPGIFWARGWLANRPTSNGWKIWELLVGGFKHFLFSTWTKSLSAWGCDAGRNLVGTVHLFGALFWVLPWIYGVAPVRRSIGATSLAWRWANRWTSWRRSFRPHRTLFWFLCFLVDKGRSSLVLSVSLVIALVSVPSMLSCWELTQFLASWLTTPRTFCTTIEALAVTLTASSNSAQVLV